CLPYQKCPPLGVCLSSIRSWLEIVSICQERVAGPYQSRCPFSGVQFKILADFFDWENKHHFRLIDLKSKQIPEGFAPSFLIPNS
ncbi:MAG: hypothetical protein IJI26_08345, partial [Clostridia bacterium]|nr:hypothetical protein [Clostridia bacterium]